MTSIASLIFLLVLGLFTSSTLSKIYKLQETIQVDTLYMLEASIKKLCILNGHHGLNEKAS